MMQNDSETGKFNLDFMNTVFEATRAMFTNKGSDEQLDEIYALMEDLFDRPGPSERRLRFQEYDD